MTVLNDIVMLLGFAVVVAAAGWLLVKALAWLRLYVVRSTGLRFSLGLNVTRAMTDLKRVGWDMKLVGFGGRRWQMGLLYGSPPVYYCERCRKPFKTEQACIDHEKEAGHEPTY